MRFLPIKVQIAIAQAFLLASIVILAAIFGMVPNRRAAEMQGRARLCEALAVNTAILVNRNDIESLHAMLETVLARHPKMLSVAVQREGGKRIVEVGDHAANWNPIADEVSVDTQLSVPIRNGKTNASGCGTFYNTPSTVYLRLKAYVAFGDANIGMAIFDGPSGYFSPGSGTGNVGKVTVRRVQCVQGLSGYCAGLGNFA